MNSSTLYSPPVFSYSSDAFDNDFDIGLLSEYLLDDDMSHPLPHGNGRKHSFSKSDFSSFPNDEDFSSNEDSESKRLKSSVEGEDNDNEGDKSDQVWRRRERNRVLARKTRLRKKFFFESLQRQVAQLSSENEMLKTIVKQRLDPDTKNQVLGGCKTELPSIVTTSPDRANSVLEKADFALMNAIQAAQRSFCITDPSMPDNPIVFASQGFLEMSGYSLDEVLGRNCRFLQGPRTDQSQVEILRNGIMNGQDVSVCMLNYKANGTPFYNQIFVAGLRDASHKIINYVGVQVEIKTPPDGADATTVPRIESRDDLASKGKSRKTKHSDGGSSSSSSGHGNMSSNSSRLPQYKSSHMVPPMPMSSSSATLALSMASNQMSSPRSAAVHIPNQYVPGGRLPATRQPQQNIQQGSGDQPPRSDS